ncbi:hypothetical protein OUZ56_002389 [Daphnia magna]|uniref:Transmembrane protein n=1 Tax=Daphnia magna TaxID=35525 RepID=A0ABR0A5Y7_9CRUS|nr:hypothetical protein OUZ56_002389 [Daphnia magna]
MPTWNKVHLHCSTMKIKLILLFFSPLLSQLTWIGFNTFSIFWTANFHPPSVQHCGFDNFGSFAASGPHASTFSLSSCRCLRFHLIAVFVDVFTFISVSSSSWPSLPSSPSRRRRLGRLRLHLRLVVLAVFAFISVSSSWPSLPSSPSRLVVLAVFAFISVSSSSSWPSVFALISVSSSSWPFLLSLSTPSPRRRFRLRPSRREFSVDRRFVNPLAATPFASHFFCSFRDRPQWPSPQGALGNAPLGTSLCRCGGGFLRVCIPCNGFRHRVSPDLSSDKSHLVRDPYDAMRSYCSLSNLRVAWPGSQRWWNCWEEEGQ